MFSLHQLASGELIQLYEELLQELKQRGTVRSRNAPIADYAEWLVCHALELERMKPSEPFDALDEKGKKYEIKARLLRRSPRSIALGQIRNLQVLDFLVAVVFQPDVSIRKAVVIPRAVVEKYAKYTEHTNSFRFSLRPEVERHAGVRDITDIVSETAGLLAERESWNRFSLRQAIKSDALVETVPPVEESSEERVA